MPLCNVIEKYIYIEFKLCSRLDLQQTKELHLVLGTWKILHLSLKWSFTKQVELTKYTWIISQPRVQLVLLDSRFIAETSFDLATYYVSYYHALKHHLWKTVLLGIVVNIGNADLWILSPLSFSGVYAPDYNSTVLMLRKPCLSCDRLTW